MQNTIKSSKALDGSVRELWPWWMLVWPWWLEVGEAKPTLCIEVFGSTGEGIVIDLLMEATKWWMIP